MEKTKSGIIIPKSDSLKIKGKVKATVARMKKPQHFRLYEEILRRIKMKLPFIDLVRELNYLCTIRIFETPNTVCTVGRSMIADNLTNSGPDHTMLVNYTAVGDDSTAPVIGDTALGNETYRKTPPASLTNSNNIAYITAFYTAAEAIDTHKECGLFSDGSGVADSGVLLIHASIDISKTGVDTLTVDHTLTIS